jgi:hypothetical protein
MMPKHANRVVRCPDCQMYHVARQTCSCPPESISEREATEVALRARLKRYLHLHREMRMRSTQAWMTWLESQASDLLSFDDRVALAERLAGAVEEVPS